MEKGWIVLDLDGTVVDGFQPIYLPVVDYLHTLQKSGWKMLFLTGRTFSSAQKSLITLSFPYFLGVQNGADIVEMPLQKAFEPCYLDSEILSHADRAYQGEPENYLVYAGFAKGDFCYYRPESFSLSYRNYCQKLQNFCSQPWQIVQSSQELLGMQFSLLKCLGPEKTVRAVAEKLSLFSDLEITVIRDTGFDPRFFLALVTNHEATKGKALRRILKKTGWKEGERIIVAGDDFNDLSMLREADIKIVVETAPPEILAEADIVAQPPSKMGMIRALAAAVGGTEGDRNE